MRFKKRIEESIEISHKPHDSTSNSAVLQNAGKQHLTETIVVKK